MSEIQSNEEKELTLVDHLIELRDRVLKCLVAIVVLFLALFYFDDKIYTFIAQPLIDVMPEGTGMIAIDPIAPFLAPFKLTFYAALLVAMPYILYQIWSFIAPGLYKNEKTVAIPLFVSSVFLFYAGVAFARFVLFGFVFAFIMRINPDIITYTPDITSFLSFTLTLFFAFGIAFEIPIAVFIFIWAGIAEPNALAEKRPYVIIGCFVVAMLLTPPDPFTQPMLAIPMWALFEVGIIAGRIIVKKKEKEEQLENS